MRPIRQAVSHRQPRYSHARAVGCAAGQFLPNSFYLSGGLGTVGAAAGPRHPISGPADRSELGDESLELVGRPAPAIFEFLKIAA
jgi:hypothetical protein